MTDRSNSFFPAKLSSTAYIGKNCSKSRYILKNYQNRRAGRFSVRFAKVFQFRVSFFRIIVFESFSSTMKLADSRSTMITS